MARKKAALDFEQSLADLQTLVERLENGELSLEDSLTAFEQGIRLTRDCQGALAQAEQKVQVLLERDGELAESQPTRNSLNDRRVSGLQSDPRQRCTGSSCSPPPALN